ncbi:MAG TPA: baseplate J/gp47 family protein, partial [Ktedonobacteraceae bacterium]|nr:baseplate J/gp47 family protein [Ktedonobacteraceae bacterium]
RPSQNLRPAPTTQRPSQTLKPAQTTQRPSQTLAPAQAARQRPSQNLRPAPTTQRPSQTLKPAQAQRPSQGLRPGAAAPRGRSGPAAGSRTPLLAPPAAARGRQPQARRSNRTPVVIFTLIVLLLIVAGLLLYFVPTATVTISLQAQSYSQNVQLVASANPASGTPGEIQAQTLEYSTPVNGQSTASGQTRVGDTRAQGQVSFTNNGTADVVIPTGTIVQTTSGIAFQTQAEALVGHGGSFPAVPITAQQAGVSGNVGANTITVIPAESLSKIAANNHVSTQSLSLTVTNPQATSQGGARTVPAATQKDIDALKRTLHKQLQQNLTSWLNAQTHKGDFHGTPMPNILASANPLSGEQFSGLPSVGQAEESGTFTGTLTAHIKVLIARASAVSAAAHAILKADALQTHPTPMMLAEQLPVTLANPKTSASADGTKLTISGKATGAVIKQINALAISGTLAGKNVDQASNELKTSMARVGIQNVQITVTPSFLSFMPWRADHIQVILQATPPPPANPVPNG